MRRHVLIGLLAGLLVPGLAAALGPAPSWQLNQGAPNTCSSTGGFPMPGVEINIPTGQASERGVLSAPGNPSLGFTQDSAFGPFVGPSSFFVFVSAPYSLPANTPLTLEVTTYTGVNQTGAIAFVSRLTWNCTTGVVIPDGPTEPIPTLSEVALALLVLTMLVMGAGSLRRRR